MKIYEAEISYRVAREGTPELCDSPERAIEYMEGAFNPDPTVEWFYAILLNRKNRAIGRVPITKGTATASLVHPREVFKPAILAGACGIICVHNHPSGDPSPSMADIQATRTLREAAKVIQIDLLDHIVIGDKDLDPKGTGYHSFAEEGLL